MEKGLEVERNAIGTVILLVVLLVSICSVDAARVQIKVYHRDQTQEKAWVEALAQAVEAKYPDIDVELIPGPSGPPFAERLALLMASGEPPDIIYGSTNRIGFIHEGWILDNANLLQRDLDEIDTDDFLPGSLEEYTRGGAVYGLPISVLGQAIFYNKQLFAEAGLPPLPVSWDNEEWTWEAFVSYARKLTKLESDNTASQFGGGWFSEEAYATGKATRSALHTPENIAAYSAVRELYVENQAAANGTTPWSSQAGVSNWTAFENGRLAMEWIGWWRVRDRIAQSKTGVINFEWGIAPVPLVQNRLNTRFVDPWFICSATKHVDAAWRFVKYATSTEGLQDYCRIVSFPPARRSAIDYFLEEVSSASGLSPDEVLNAHVGTLTNGHRSFQEIIGQMKWRGLTSDQISRIVKGEIPVSNGLAQLQNQVDAILKELWAEE